MKISELEHGQSLLVLRFSLSIKKDIIELHQQMLDKNGYVWYGKLGTVTSPKIVAETFVAKKPALLLYSKGKAYLCGVSEITGNKPQGGYPRYYDDEYIFPGCYYKLTSIDEVDEEILDKLIVRSSKRFLSDTLSRQCTSSCFFVSYEEILPLRSVTEKTKKKKEKLQIDDCHYRNDGICRKNGFINYGYVCDNPSRCAKQKR